MKSCRHCSGSANSNLVMRSLVFPTSGRAAQIALARAAHHGHERDFIKAQSVATFDMVEQVPAHNAGPHRDRLLPWRRPVHQCRRTGSNERSKATGSRAIFIGGLSLYTGSNWDLRSKWLNESNRKLLSRRSSAARPMLSPRRACRPRFIGPEPFAATCQGTPIIDT